MLATASIALPDLNPGRLCNDVKLRRAIDRQGGEGDVEGRETS